MNYSSWRKNLHEIIFEAETKAGKQFDIALLFTISLSVLIVMLESVPSLNIQYKELFYTVEWFFTILFTIEYLLRIITVKNPIKYIFSFYGIVDLLSILPTFIGIYFTTSHSLRIIRILRLMRVFRVLKLIGFVSQAQILRNALKASRQKILVFMLSVTILVVILGNHDVHDRNA